MSDIIYFLCNGKNPKCKDRCRYSECCHTSNPEYAKNFSIEKDLDGNRIITEEVPGDKSGSFMVGEVKPNDDL